MGLGMDKHLFQTDTFKMHLRTGRIGWWVMNSVDESSAFLSREA